jgi:hypothetical protein
MTSDLALQRVSVAQFIAASRSIAPPIRSSRDLPNSLVDPVKTIAFY